jgi:Bacterial Ig-like domain (group 2)
VKSLFAIVVTSLTLAACGGSNPNSPAASAIEATAETFTIQITPGAALLTKSGETKALTARVLNANGNEVQKPVTWTSSNPSEVQISNTGVITAQKDLGASQIIAQVEGFKSAPMLVSVAQPAAGVTLIKDAQVRGEATLVDPNAENDTDDHYEVLLTGIAPPQAGSLLLGSEGIAVGGEVVSSVRDGDAVRVRLKLVPITQLMQTAHIKEVLDYTNLEPNFPPELTRDYDIKRVDGEYFFTPKANASVLTTKALRTLEKGPLQMRVCNARITGLVSAARAVQYQI